MRTKEKLGNILLIGSGGSVLEHDIGDQIDKFNGLIGRYNEFTTDIYAKHVGTRCEIWISCKPFTKNTMGDYKIVLWHTSQKDNQVSSSFEYIKRQQPHAVRFSNKDRKRAQKLAGYHQVTSGIVSMAYFVNKGHTVYIHGFDCWTHKTHYYDNTKRPGPGHDPAKEKAAIKKLLDSGKMFLLLDHLEDVCQ